MSRRRALLTAGVVVAVVAMLAVLPALPPVRGYLVGRVVDVLRDGGTHVDFARSAGNAWRGITLEDAEVRSEEHTSELQSRENLVCRLLLEKKKRGRTER